MGFRYKIPGREIISKLSDAGYNTNTLRKEKIIAEGTLTKLRENKMISLAQIDKICKLLSCHPNDIIEYYAEQVQVWDNNKK